MKTLLSTAALLSLGFLVPALAAPMVQPTHEIYACVDPRATTALAIPDGRLRNRKWVDYVHRTGHCFALSASQQFEVVAQQGPLVLVKPTAAGSDMPPVYAQAADVKQSADDSVPPAPTDAQAPAASETPGQPASAPPAPAPAAAPATAPEATAPTTTTPGPADAPPPAATAPSPSQSSPPATPPAENAGPVTAPLGTPAPAPAPIRSSGISALLILLVVLALLGLVAVAVAIARQQRGFAHVEDKNWPPEDDGRDPLGHAGPVAASPQRPARLPQAFRKDCVAMLEQGGWAIQPSFAIGGAEEDGSPDIVGRKQNAVLAVRCRVNGDQVNLAMIDEAAAMGRRANAHVTVLATDAPLTQRAHDEALRLHVHVLPIEELDSLSA